MKQKQNKIRDIENRPVAAKQVRGGREGRKGSLGLAHANWYVYNLLAGMPLAPGARTRALSKRLSRSSEPRQEGGLPGCSPVGAGLSPPPPHAPGPSCCPSLRPAGQFSPSVVRLLWRSSRKLSEVQPLTFVDQLVHSATEKRCAGRFPSAPNTCQKDS